MLESHFTLQFDFAIFELVMDLFGNIFESNGSNGARPFLKWAGGKTQLLNTIQNHLPAYLFNKHFTYIEPFVGSGAVLFWMIANTDYMKKIVINDSNKELINTYITIKEDVCNLIAKLHELELEYHSFKDNPEGRKNYYYSKRADFNFRNLTTTNLSALFIFLNRTCFNGLYRVNRDNKFNVPIGSYKTPIICDETNLLSVSKALKNVEIINTDFSETISFAKGRTFFYIDPPYKPLSQTSSFNSYSHQEFGDKEQTRLRDFCIKLDECGFNWMLSNSDLKGKNPEDNFFDDLYKSFYIKRVKARRSINANPDKRGELNELLITNYQNEQIMSVA